VAAFRSPTPRETGTTFRQSRSYVINQGDLMARWTTIVGFRLSIGVGHPPDEAKGDHGLSIGSFIIRTTMPPCPVSRLCRARRAPTYEPITGEQLLYPKKFRSALARTTAAKRWRAD